MLFVYHNYRRDIYIAVTQKQQAMALLQWREKVPTAHKEVYELLLVLWPMKQFMYFAETT